MTIKKIIVLSRTKLTLHFLLFGVLTFQNIYSVELHFHPFIPYKIAYQANGPIDISKPTFILSPVSMKVFRTVLSSLNYLLNTDDTNDGCLVSIFRF